MKNLILTLSIAVASFYTYAQTNTFPSIGNVGIGTTGPTANLQINNAADSRLLIYETGTAPYTATLELASQAVGTYGGIVQYSSNDEIFRVQNYGRTISGQNHGSILFRTKINNTTPTDVMAINGYSGNVGIGATNPSAKLDVAGWTGGNDIKFENYSPSLTGNENQSLVFTGSDNSGISKGNYELLRMKVISTNGGIPLSKVQFTQNGSSSPTMVFNPDFKVGIGTSSPDEKLTVKGNIHAAEVKVEALSAIPDYVFESNYKLTSLKEIKAYVDKNHHLPEIPSAKEIERDGIQLGDMNMKLLKKIEELTLYLIEQKETAEKQSRLQQQQIDQLKEQLNKVIKY